MNFSRNSSVSSLLKVQLVPFDSVSFDRCKKSPAGKTQNTLALTAREEVENELKVAFGRVRNKRCLLDSCNESSLAEKIYYLIFT